MTDAPYTLILLRHGESEWNALNLFTGWVDVDLTEKGVTEAATRTGSRVGRSPCTFTTTSNLPAGS